MTKINSRQKGAQGEREWRDELRKHGYHAERGRQHHGRADAPDVLCPDLPFHWEVKRVENLNVEKALQQAERDCNRETQVPLVAHRRNKETWKITMWASDFFAMLDGGKDGEV